MRPARFKIWLLTAVLLAAGSQLAHADGEAVPPGDATPPLGALGPSDVRYDLDLFAPPDLSTYANWPRPHEGFFFSYDRLYWALSGPRRNAIGASGTGVGYMTDTGVNAFVPETTSPLAPPVAAQNPHFILQNYDSTTDTGFIQANQVWGNRYELGWEEDNKGWLVSIMNLQRQTQSFTMGSIIGGLDAGVVIRFNDPQHLLYGFVDTNGDGFDDDTNIGIPGVPSSSSYRVPTVFGRPKIIGGTGTPVNIDTTNSGIPTAYAGFTDFGDEVPLVPIFNQVTAVNITSMVGTEITRTWRYPTTQYGVWDLLFGIRWLQLRDQFGVLAVTDPVGAPLATNPIAMPGDSFWNNVIDNNMVGPQIGFRYNHDVARFNLLAEFRFMAAVNFQSDHLDGELASGLSSGATAAGTAPPGSLDRLNEPLLLERTSFRSWRYDETFAPVGELRCGLNYQLTKAIGVQAEYNAILGGGIGRASRRIDYVVPALQILPSNKNDSFFTDGLSLGITFNR
jgi:hypothetical protein